MAAAADFNVRLLPEAVKVRLGEMCVEGSARDTVRECVDLSRKLHSLAKQVDEAHSAECLIHVYEGIASAGKSLQEMLVTARSIADFGPPMNVQVCWSVPGSFQNAQSLLPLSEKWFPVILKDSYTCAEPHILHARKSLYGGLRSTGLKRNTVWESLLEQWVRVAGERHWIATRMLVPGFLTLSYEARLYRQVFDVDSDEKRLANLFYIADFVEVVSSADIPRPSPNIRLAKTNSEYAALLDTAVVEHFMDGGGLSTPQTFPERLPLALALSSPYVSRDVFELEKVVLKDIRGTTLRTEDGLVKRHLRSALAILIALRTMKKLTQPPSEPTYFVPSVYVESVLYAETRRIACALPQLGADEEAAAEERIGELLDYARANEARLCSRGQLNCRRYSHCTFMVVWQGIVRDLDRLPETCSRAQVWKAEQSRALAAVSFWMKLFPQEQFSAVYYPYRDSRDASFIAQLASLVPSPKLPEKYWAAQEIADYEIGSVSAFLGAWESVFQRSGVWSLLYSPLHEMSKPEYFRIDGKQRLLCHNLATALRCLSDPSSCVLPETRDTSEESWLRFSELVLVFGGLHARFPDFMSTATSRLSGDERDDFLTSLCDELDRKEEASPRLPPVVDDDTGAIKSLSVVSGVSMELPDGSSLQTVVRAAEELLLSGAPLTVGSLKTLVGDDAAAWVAWAARSRNAAPPTDPESVHQYLLQYARHVEVTAWLFNIARKPEWATQLGIKLQCLPFIPAEQRLTILDTVEKLRSEVERLHLEEPQQQQQFIDEFLDLRIGLLLPRLGLFDFEFTSDLQFIMAKFITKFATALPTAA